MTFTEFVSVPFFSPALGWIAGKYIRFVYDTAHIVYEPSDAQERARALHPAIFAFWHGMAMMAPVAKPIDIPSEVMISRDRAASIIAIGAEKQGLDTIRASGAIRRDAVAKNGGATGFRQALRALREGHSVLMTADVPKMAQVAGRGVVMLARHSGRPIVPVAYVSRRAVHFHSWDHMAVDLPYSRAANVQGRPMVVAADASDEALDAHRRALSIELDRVMARAHELVGRSECFRPRPRDDD